jgi:cyclophilin family peptidyl-prolyl cis-trans isomerase
MSFRKLASAIAFVGSLASASPLWAAAPDNTMIITLKDGDVTIALRPDLAPKHVEQIKKLVREGAYDNVAFHRVIDGFMAQTGDVQYGDRNDGYDPQLAGTGGSKLPDIPAEFTDKESYERGVVGMARSSDPNSANSQFFIMFAPNPGLDGQYTIVGEVESGMELVDKIKRGDGGNGEVTDPDRMIKVRIAADK